VKRSNRSWRAQPEAANLEIFLKAIGLEEIGEFEGADIAALSTDFALKIDNDGVHVGQGVAGAQELKPAAFAVKGQTQGLAS
jgi:hypothetical protein